ncbi:hypothetical protein F4824DRAFT_516905 [Ustulina deusta]|nr:hypothetical protein F4824DRAFT_516905 [Ustulina deusta]
MEAFGTAAAVTELLSLSIKVSKAAKSLVESFANAPDELVQLATKLTHIQLRIQQLYMLDQELSVADSAVLLPSEHQTVLSTGLQTNLEALQAVQSLCNARLGNSETIGTRRLTSLNQISLGALNASHSLLHSELKESTKAVKELIHVEIQGLIRDSSVDNLNMTAAVSDDNPYQPTHTENTLCVHVKTARQNHRRELEKQSPPVLTFVSSTHTKERLDPGMRLIEHDMRRSLSTHSVVYGSLRRLHTTEKRAIGAMLTVQSKRNRRKLRLVFEIGFKLFSQHVLRFELNLRQTARRWTSMPTVDCSMPIFNVRPNDAPIFQACRDKDVNRVRYLLESGQASVHDVDDEVGGLLEHALKRYCRMGSYTSDLDENYHRIQQLVQHLLDQGCDPNTFYGPIRWGRLPAILWAFDWGYSSAVSALLLHGADIVSFDSIVPGCLQDVNAGFEWKLKILRSVGFSDWKPESRPEVLPATTILHGACESSNVQEVLFALEVAGLDPDMALATAVRAGFLKGAAILIECGATSTEGTLINTRKLCLRAPEVARFFSYGVGDFWASGKIYEWYISDLENAEQTRRPRLNFGWTRSGRIYRASSGQDGKGSQGGETEEARPTLVQTRRCQSSNGTVNNHLNDARVDSAHWGEENPQVSRDELKNPCDLGSFFRYQTQFCHHTSSAEGRRRLTRFPMVLALCDALQFAGYRAEMDDDGDIWYEIDDGDRYFDAKEHQDGDGRGDWIAEFCPICQDFERHGLGHVLEKAEEAKRELREYREKVRAAKYGV